MSVDTLALFHRMPIDAHDVQALAGHGWTLTTRRKDGRETVEATTVLGNGARLRVYATLDGDSDQCGVKVEASLPKILSGANDHLLDWADCQYAAILMTTEASQSLGCRLPPAGDWRVKRIDPVYAWDVDPRPYLAALSRSVLARRTTCVYPTSVAWKLPKGGTTARAYNKAAQVGYVVALPLRVESQAQLPRQHLVSDSGQLAPRLWSEWDGPFARGVVRRLIANLGLDRPITVDATLSRLVAAHGKTAGRNTYAAVLAAERAGGWHQLREGAESYTRVSADRYRRLAAQAGVVAISEAELAPLTVPP